MSMVITFDRPAFGLTERPLHWQGQNPYCVEAQIALLFGLLDRFGGQQAILVGNSAGGTVAMQAALANPERVSMLILVDSAFSTGSGAPEWIRLLLSTPQMRRLGPLGTRLTQNRGSELLETAWHNPALISQKTKELYQKPQRVENWDRALWEFTLTSRAFKVADHLGEFTLPVLVITGDDDCIVPTADNVRLAGELPNASLVVIDKAGHVPHEEQSAAFIDAVRIFDNENT